MLNFRQKFASFKKLLYLCAVKIKFHPFKEKSYVRNWFSNRRCYSRNNPDAFHRRNNGFIRLIEEIGISAEEYSFP